MKIYNEYHATDRRYYNGCPSNDLARELKSKNDARDYLKEHDINITYFPNGCFYVGFQIFANHAPKIITQDCKSFEACVNECLEYINKRIIVRDINENIFVVA